MKIDLRGLTPKEIQNIILAFEEPNFRARQIFSWIQGKSAASFDDMKNIPLVLRTKLAAGYGICGLKLLTTRKSVDGTMKFLWGLPDGEKIESVLLDDAGRKTLCVSTQVGCRMACGFCATARVRFKRHLTAGEIISQVIEAQKITGEKISNLVYMGMGEPLDNYDPVIKSIRILNHPDGQNIGQRKITISTCGLINEIKKLADENLQVTLAVSLNAGAGEKRSQLIPVNRLNPLPELIKALKMFSAVSGRRVTLEYVLIKDFNDSPEDARQLLDLTVGLKSNINLIAFNEFPAAVWKTPTSERINGFRLVLEKAGRHVTQRFKRGREIAAACGQLTADS